MRAICGAGDTASWVGPFAFTTLCDPFTTPYLEDFSNFLPQCWDEAGDGNVSTGPLLLGSGDWVTDDFGNNTANTAAARLNLYSNTDSEWLISPFVDLSTNGTHWLEFDFAVTDYANTAPESLGSDDTVQVLITTDFGTTWTVLEQWTSASQVSNTGEHVIIDLAAYFGDIVQVAFRGTDGAVNDLEDYDVFIDNVSIDQAPACPAFVDGLAASAASSSTADVSFDTTGSNATTFIVEYGVNGFTQGTGTIVNTSGNTAGLSGLNAGTTYDVYVAVVCNSGDTGIVVGPVSFTTFFSAPYFEDFENVSTGSQANFGNGWTNQSPTSFDWHGNSGTTTSTNTGPDGDHTTGNGLYLFTEASDGASGDTAWLYSPVVDINSLTNPYLSFWYHRYGADLTTGYVDIWNGTSWIALDSLVGESQSDNSDPYLELDADLNSFSGNVQLRFWTVKDDFDADWAIDDVRIYSKPNDDLGVIAFVEPADFCGDTATELALVIQNFGIDPQTGFNIAVDVTGSASFNINYTYNGTIQEGEVDTVIVDTLNTSLGGVFNMTAYTVLAGEENYANDSSTVLGVAFTPEIPMPSVAGNANELVCIGEDGQFVATGITETALWRNDTGAIVATGDTFVVDSVVGPQTFYLYDAAQQGDSLGLHENVGSTSFLSQAAGWGLGFSVYSNSTIDSVTVYPTGTGTIEILILDQTTNTVVYTGPTTAISGPGANVVPVGANLPAGDYKMGMASTGISNLIRETAIGGFPYNAASGMVSITGGSTGTGAPTSSSYYWFYNWHITSLGCESAPLEVSVDTNPPVVVSLGADTAICNNLTFALPLDAGNSGATYAWNTGDTTQVLSVDSAGLYSVEVVASNGCIGFDTLEVLELSAPIVDLGSDTAFCENEAFMLSLDAGNAGSTFTWQDNSTGQTFDATQPGTFYVVVENVEGCVESDTMLVSELSAPEVTLSDEEACEGETITLDAGAGFETYSWTGSMITTQTLDVDTAGTFEVIVSNAEGCFDTASAEVVFNENPVVDLGSDTSIISGTSITLDAGNVGSIFDWNTGDDTQTIEVTEEGTYSVVVTNSFDCSSSDTIVVDVIAGVNEIALGEVKFYPNPTRDMATLQFDLQQSGEVLLEVYALNGQLVHSQKTSAGTGEGLMNIDAGSLGKGIYIVNVMLNNERITQLRMTVL